MNYKITALIFSILAIFSFYYFFRIEELYMGFVSLGSFAGITAVFFALDEVKEHHMHLKKRIEQLENQIN